MTLTYVLMQNLRRNPLRSGLTAVAFALPMGVFVVAISLVVLLIQIGEIAEKELRLATRNKTSLTSMLPEGHRRKIEGLDPNRERLRAVCGMRWFGGRIPGEPNALTSLAADPDTFPIVYSDVGMTADDIAAWNAKRTAAVIGRGYADQYRWAVGDRLVLQSTVPPYLELEFHVVKIIENKERANVFYLRRDYLDESLLAAGEEAGRCNIFWTKCNSAAALRSLQAEIDENFANSPEETKSEDENAFGANFMQAGGDLPGLMRTMAFVVLYIVALVAGNTMVMSFRERTREIAVFKAIGFQSRRIFTIVLAESTLLALVGALCGVVPTAIGLTLFPMTQLRIGPLATIEVSPIAVVASLVIAVLVGLAAGLWPAYQALRLRTVDALRRIA